MIMRIGSQLAIRKGNQKYIAVCAVQLTEFTTVCMVEHGLPSVHQVHHDVVGWRN